jgi:multidrug efflux pump subunit AcrA (membrane-fusion protein)
MEDALFSRSQADITRQGQAAQEQLFGRGLGLSTLQGEIERQRADALAQARRDAFLASQQASLSALAQAAQHQTQQQSLAQRAQESKQAVKSAREGQWTGAGAGLGAAALGTAGRIYGPDIKSGLAGLFGRGATLGQVPGLPTAGTPMAQAANVPLPISPITAPETGMPSAGLGFGDADFGVPDTGFDFNFDAPPMSIPEFDYSGLESLFNFGYGMNDFLVPDDYEGFSGV